MKIKLKQLECEGSSNWIEKEIYLDGILQSNLDLGVKQLHKDWDQVWFIDGAEGAGKSSLAITLAYYVSPPERRHNLIDRIILKIEDTPTIIKNARPNDSIVIDESYGGMSSTGAMNKLNRMLQRMFTEIRAKNLFIFILAPSFMDINRYFAIWRSKCLLHVYSDKDERGFCSFFNSTKKKQLYILGKKQFYNYECVKPNFRFRFTKPKDVIDFNKYQEMKKAKNLDAVDEEQKPTPQLMKQCWIKFLYNVKNKQLKKPLTQEQRGELIELCERTIRLYDAELKEMGDR